MKIKSETAQVYQTMYSEFGEHSQTEYATATEWWNGEGVDINIQRKNMADINISLGHDDISLFRKIFSDIDF